MRDWLKEICYPVAIVTVLIGMVLLLDRIDGIDAEIAMNSDIIIDQERVIEQQRKQIDDLKSDVAAFKDYVADVFRRVADERRRIGASE